MNRKLARILRDRIAPVLPFSEKIAGLVQTLEYKDPIGPKDSDLLTKRMPVSCDASFGVGTTPERDLVPGGAPGILYFEDGGSRLIKRNSMGTQWNSTLVLVCWMNREQIGTRDPYADLTPQVITSIAQKISGNPFNAEGFTRIRATATNIQPQDKGVFSRYTYDEATNQYLRPPFEFFAITLSCSFVVPEAVC